MSPLHVCNSIKETKKRIQQNQDDFLDPSYIGEGGGFRPPKWFLLFSRKFFPATYDETLCKFLLYTYKDSHNSFWSKILSREYVEYVYVAWVENVNIKDCNFRVLRGIFWGVSILYLKAIKCLSVCLCVCVCVCVSAFLGWLTSKLVGSYHLVH